MDAIDDEKQLDRVDSLHDLDSASTTSGLSSVLSSDDFRSSSSSGDICVTSSSSGEIPAVIAAEAVETMIASVVDEPPTTTMTLTVSEAAARRKCVGRNNRAGVQWGLTSVIGRRREMEDAIAVKPGFMSTRCDQVGGCTAQGSRTSGEISPLHFFGVYDGHGGSQVRLTN